MDCRIAGAKGYGDFHFNFTRLSHERDHRQMREWWIFSFLSQNVKLYHGVQRGARNGIDTSDWIWIPECPVGSAPASAFSSLNFIFLTTAS